MNIFFGNRANRTFKPKKNIPEGTHQYDLMRHAAATLGSGNLRLAVMLPDGEDLNEWVAVNTVDFFNQINMLYGTITEFCIEDSCPLMSAGPKYEYHWADGQTVKKPIKCSAPKYIDYLMTWVQDQLDDDTIFPSKIGVAFPKNFNSIAKTIFKRLFRVYAHIYHQHFSQVVQLGEEAHLNTSFKHFIYFVQEFNLIDKRELAPLNELIDKLTGNHPPHSQSQASGNHGNHLNSHPESAFQQANHQPPFMAQQFQNQSPPPPLLPQASSYQRPQKPQPPVPTANPYKSNTSLAHFGSPIHPSMNQQVPLQQQQQQQAQQSTTFQQSAHHGLPAHIMFQQQQYHQQFQNLSNPPPPFPPPAYHQAGVHQQLQQQQQQHSPYRNMTEFMNGPGPAGGALGGTR